MLIGLVLEGCYTLVSSTPVTKLKLESIEIFLVFHPVEEIISWMAADTDL